MTSRASGAAFVRPKSLRLLPFLCIAFGFSWTLWLATWWLAGKPDTLADPAILVAVYVGSFGPGLAGAVMSAREGTLRAWLGDFLRWRIGWRGLAAIALPLPLGALALTVLLGYAPVADEGSPPVLFYATIFPAVILNGAVTALLGAGPLGEEGGWRGYLLPRMLGSMGEWRASLLIGIIWSAWHLPIMAILPDWRDGHSIAFYLPSYTLVVMGLSVIMTRIWLLSRRSTLAAVWMHGIINALGSVAFNAKMWGSAWSAEANMLHFGAAVWLTAIVLSLVPLARESVGGCRDS